MQKISLTIRVDLGDLERWKRASGGVEGNLSEWIRVVLNDRVAARKGAGSIPASETKQSTGLCPHGSEMKFCRIGTCAAGREK